MLLEVKVAPEALTADATEERSDLRVHQLVTRQLAHERAGKRALVALQLLVLLVHYSNVAHSVDTIRKGCLTQFAREPLIGCGWMLVLFVTGEVRGGVKGFLTEVADFGLLSSVLPQVDLKIVGVRILFATQLTLELRQFCFGM